MSPAADATGVATTANVTVTFSESMDPATITTGTIELRDRRRIAGARRDDLQRRRPGPRRSIRRTRCWTSSAYTAIVRGGPTGVKDLAGNAMAADVTWSFTTAAAAWPVRARSGRTPRRPRSPPIVHRRVELGVKLRADVDGFVTGSAVLQGRGQHRPARRQPVDGTGTLLGSVTFTGETASGWQQVALADAGPRPRQHDLRRVVSHADRASRLDGEPVHRGRRRHAPAARAGERRRRRQRRLHRTARRARSPTQSFAASNYWVDVVFNTTAAADTTPPTVTAVTPAGRRDRRQRGRERPGDVQRADEPGDHHHRDGRAAQCVERARWPATVSYNAATRTATLDPTGPLADSATYTATVKGGAAGVKDVAGNPLAADFTWSFTTAAGVAVPCTIWPDDRDAGGPRRSVHRHDRAGREMADRRRRIRHRSAVLQGRHQHRHAHRQRVDEHRHAARHASTFSGETASGWQQVALPTPVPVLANTTYVASYHTTTGHFSTTENQFTAAGVDAPPLHALANGVAGGNGVFIESATSAFPNQTFAREQLLGRRRVQYLGRE